MDNLRPLTREEYYHEKNNDPEFIYKMMRNPLNKFGHYVPYKDGVTGKISWFWTNDTVSSKRHVFPKDDYELTYG